VRLRPRRQSRVKWICATAAPWALATGLLISFTAAAGNDPQAGVSAAGRSPSLLADAIALVLPSEPAAGPALGTERPRGAGKAAPPPYFPEVERAAKGDPLVDIAPSLSRRAGDVRDGLGPAARLIYGRDERLLPPTILMPGEVRGPDLDEQVFEPWTMPDLTTTRQTSSVQSPAAAAAGSTGAAVSATTPSVGRAVALSSTTPAPADATPIEIAAAPVSGPQSSRLDRLPETAAVALPPDPGRPRYAELIDPDNMDREQRCLAEAIYFEARSEPEEGQAAVAQVVLNRVRSGLYPGSICGVVYQNRHRYKACQFTFACEGKSLRITDRESWTGAQRVAHEVLEGKTYVAEVGASTHYHANYVRPTWSRRLKKMDVIGRHIFYKLRPGQT
jgi:hypothetical protein